MSQGIKGNIASVSKEDCFQVKIRFIDKLAKSSIFVHFRSWLYQNGMKTVIANVVKGESILLKSNGGAYRSFCYVTDTVTALLLIMLEGVNATPYNIAADHSNTTIRNFAREAVKVFPERNLTLSFAKKEDEAEPDLSQFTVTPEILDHQRLDELGWKAEISLSEGIKRSVETLEEIVKA